MLLERLAKCPSPPSRKREPSIDLFGARKKNEPITCPHEETEQILLFQWRDLSVKDIPELRWLHSSLNGVPLSPGLASKMKRMGMTRGVVDVFLPIVRGGYAGLYIEMKRSNGVPSHLSDSQKSSSFCERARLPAEWCKGWIPARDLILEYLEVAQ